MGKSLLNKTDIELGKKAIESKINTDLNEVKYNEEFNTYLVSNIIPSTKFFEYRLDNTDRMIEKLIVDVDKKFDSMQTDMDKRFEQVDKRFDAMQSDFKDMDRKFDKKFDQLFLLLENRDKEMRNMIYDNAKEQRGYTRNMFTAAISISILGILGIFLKMSGIFG